MAFARISIPTPTDACDVTAKFEVIEVSPGSKCSAKAAVQAPSKIFIRVGVARIGKSLSAWATEVSAGRTVKEAIPIAPKTASEFITANLAGNRV